MLTFVGFSGRLEQFFFNVEEVRDIKAKAGLPFICKLTSSTDCVLLHVMSKISSLLY
jgi:hypothetical protein